MFRVIDSRSLNKTLALLNTVAQETFQSITKDAQITVSTKIPWAISPNLFGYFNRNSDILSNSSSVKLVNVPWLIEWFRIINHEICTMDRHKRIFKWISIQSVCKFNLKNFKISNRNEVNNRILLTKFSSLDALPTIQVYFMKVFLSAETIQA